MDVCLHASQRAFLYTLVQTKTCLFGKGIPPAPQHSVWLDATFAVAAACCNLGLPGSLMGKTRTFHATMKTKENKNKSRPQLLWHLVAVMCLHETLTGLSWSMRYLRNDLTDSTLLVSFQWLSRDLNQAFLIPSHVVHHITLVVPWDLPYFITTGMFCAAQWSLYWNPALRPTSSTTGASNMGPSRYCGTTTPISPC